MNPALEVTIPVNVTGPAATLQRIRNAVANRRLLNARIAVAASGLTRKYVAGLQRHKTAEKLGAKPTGHLQRASRGIEAASDAERAIIRIPRASGLGRAFYDITIRPGSGKRFLTIPADRRTYGRRAGEFPPGALVFSTVGGRYPALMFKDSWTVAYWLVREVTQKQDRTLLPSDSAWLKTATGTAAIYLRDVIRGRTA